MRESSRSRVARFGVVAAGAALGLGLLAAAVPTADAADSGTVAARVELGRRLFFDPAVSRLGATSCASCHDPEQGFSDPARRSDTGRFRVPNLRDVARRAPYMHDGSLATLEDVVRYYDRGGSPNEHLDAALHPLGLSDADVADVVAFLHALTGDERPGLGALTAERSKSVRVRVVDLDGAAVADARIVVRPVGDRLRGTHGMPEPFEVRTDRNGVVEIPFPASTHIALDLAGHELGAGRLLPDCAEKVTLMATPVDTVSVVVHKGGNLIRLPSELQLAPHSSMLRSVLAPGAAGSGVLRRTRTLGSSAALYTAKVADLRALAGVSAVACSTTALGDIGVFRLDLTGGATEPLFVAAEKPDAGVLRETAALERRLVEALTSAPDAE